jgi:hypothetical protein
MTVPGSPGATVSSRSRPTVIACAASGVSVLDACTVPASGTAPSVPGTAHSEQPAATAFRLTTGAADGEWHPGASGDRTGRVNGLSGRHLPAPEGRSRNASAAQVRTWGAAVWGIAREQHGTGKPSGEAVGGGRCARLPHTGTGSGRRWSCAGGRAARVRADPPVPGTVARPDRGGRRAVSVWR